MTSGHCATEQNGGRKAFNLNYGPLRDYHLHYANACTERNGLLGDLIITKRNNPYYIYIYIYIYIHTHTEGISHYG